MAVQFSLKQHVFILFIIIKNKHILMIIVPDALVGMDLNIHHAKSR